MKHYIIPVMCGLVVAASAQATTLDANVGVKTSSVVQTETSSAAVIVSRTLTKYPAVATSATVNPAAPVAGSNSFTQAQVRARLEEMGYTNVRNFIKAENGVWHVYATRNGKTYPLTFDYQGNVRVHKRSSTR